MKYIYLTFSIILAFIAFNFGWFIEGQTAIEAAKQVKTGFDYQAARTGMIFWENVLVIIKMGSGLFLLLFFINFFKKKQNKI